MTNSLSDALIVSIHGRGNWLATDLATRGWKVHLVDLSERALGSSPADIEGPHGLFEAGITESQIARYQPKSISLRRGFTLWLNDGPIELRGDVSKLQLKRRAISERVEDYVRTVSVNEPAHDRKSSGRARKLSRAPFTENWFAQFAHQIAANIAHEDDEALSFGLHVPLFSPFRIREMTADQYKNDLQVCLEAGVRVTSTDEVGDARFERNTLTSFGALPNSPARTITWMLSSHETRDLKAFADLYPHGPIEPDWVWTRFPFAVENFSSDQIPTHAVLIDDLYLPWSHSNFIVSRRTEVGVDLWVKVPSSYRTDSVRLSETQASLISILRRRLPNARVIAMEEPVERGLLHGLYEREKLEGLRLRRAKNLYFCGPEQWEFIDHYGALRAQTELLRKFVILKAQWEAVEARRARRLPTSTGSPDSVKRESDKQL